MNQPRLNTALDAERLYNALDICTGHVDGVADCKKCPFYDSECCDQDLKDAMFNFLKPFVYWRGDN